MSRRRVPQARTATTTAYVASNQMIVSAAVFSAALWMISLVALYVF